MEEKKTSAIELLTKVIEELATNNTKLEIKNKELQQSSDDWYKYFTERKEQAEKLGKELEEAKAEIEALKAERGE
jgi:malate synthase